MNAPFASPNPDAPQPSAQMLPPLAERREVRKAVILAAGRGRRMGKLTADRPKGALEVGGHALIDWQIEALRAAGVKEIAVVTGHAPEALAGRDVTYIYNPDWEKGTQVETLLKASDWIGDEPVIVSYSDIIYHPCAALALLERPGDIVVAYDADHRWLWKRRFGNWLKDSETFKLGPGQVLTEIGGRPRDIEEVEGQFIGLMLLNPSGLNLLAHRFTAASPDVRRNIDFTSLLALLIGSGVRVDTAANLQPWMEIDSTRDLRIASEMADPHASMGTEADLAFPSALEGTTGLEGSNRAFDEVSGPTKVLHSRDADGTSKVIRWNDFTIIQDHTVENAFAVQNWGRSGSTFLQSLFDDHPQVVATPNFYSRHFFVAWSTRIGLLPDSEKIGAFLTAFRQWWDTGRVDASAGLHRLGDDKKQIAGVNRHVLEGYLRAALPEGEPISRRRMFEAGHIAYALARGQVLSRSGLQVLFPVHGEPRSVAAALLEDYPKTRFLLTIREPVANTAASIAHIRRNALDTQVDALGSSLLMLFGRISSRYSQTFTLFGDREYFGWLVDEDQIRALRLEDLHQHGPSLMYRVGAWLGLKEDSRLEKSTWDGKKWWNRPESGVGNALGTQSQAHHASELLSDGDRVLIMDLAECSPLLRAAYLGATSRSHRLRLTLGVFHFWRFEKFARPSRLQTLLAARFITVRHGGADTSWLDEQIRRELERARMLSMNSGAALLRCKLPDAEKPATVQALLLLSPVGREWRVRAISKVNVDCFPASDRIRAAFLDDSLRDESVGDHLRWIFVRSVGAFVVRVRAFWRIRKLIFAISRHKEDSPRNQLSIFEVS